MGISNKKYIFRLAALAALGIAAFAQQASAACEGQVYIRLWQPGGQETWYNPGEQIDMPAGVEGHIYIHTQARGSNKYSTSARIGYPGEFGLGGDALQVERSVKMQAQNNDDRNQGRIRFRTDQPGRVQLGYTINGVAAPGNMNAVPGNCRTGGIWINVGGGGGRDSAGRGDDRGGRGGDDRGGRGGDDRGGRGGDDRGGRGGDDRGGRGGDDRGGWNDDRGGRGDDRGGRDGRDGRGGGGRGNASRQAASNLVGLLYEGILRRDDAGQIDEGYVRLVQSEGQEGLEKVAMGMLKSTEFQQQALTRIQNEQGRMRDRAEQIDALLNGIYSWIYGDAEPPQRRAQQDYQMLDFCLKRDNRSCDNLGRSLIENPLFEQGNGDDLDVLY